MLSKTTLPRAFLLQLNSTKIRISCHEALKKKDANAWRKIKAVKWANFAVSSCLKFGFPVAIRKTRRTTVSTQLPFQVKG